MNRKLLIVVGSLLAIGIAIVFIAPAYDIQPTALRASHSAKMIALAICSQVLLLFAIRVFGIVLFGHSFLQPARPDILDLTCSRLR